MNSNRINVSLFEEKVGYDSANKRMICRVYDSLSEYLTDFYDYDWLPSKVKSWSNVIRIMFKNENDEAGLRNIAINGYYSTIRTILKDIGVIEYKGRTLVKGPNWDRFYSDEDWSWFKTSTQSGGYGEIVK